MFDAPLPRLFFIFVTALEMLTVTIIINELDELLSFFFVFNLCLSALFSSTDIRWKKISFRCHLLFTVEFIETITVIKNCHCHGESKSVFLLVARGRSNISTNKNSSKKTRFNRPDTRSKKWFKWMLLKMPFAMATKFRNTRKHIKIRIECVASVIQHSKYSPVLWNQNKTVSMHKWEPV